MHLSLNAHMITTEMMSNYEVNVVMKKKASIHVCQFLKINFISCIYKLKQIHISIRGLLINYIRGRLPGRSKKYKVIQLPYLYCVEQKEQSSFKINITH